MKEAYIRKLMKGFNNWKINFFMTEAVIIYKPVSTNQWSGFYMITASVMKELSS